MELLKRLLVEEEGQGLVEYTLIVVLVALVFWWLLKVPISAADWLLAGAKSPIASRVRQPVIHLRNSELFQEPWLESGRKSAFGQGSNAPQRKLIDKILHAVYPLTVNNNVLNI